MTNELQQFVKGFARHRCQMRFLYFLHEPDTLHGPNTSLKGGVRLLTAVS